MDPTNPASFNHRTELLSTGRTYHFVDQLPANYDPASTITLLCLHGFPDLWYGWRYLIKPWVKAGYRVVAPDQLGYGGSDKPEHESEYTPKKIANDHAALLDLLCIPKAVVIGHDWGSVMASRLALWHPNRLLALVIMSVPFIPPSRQYVSLDQTVEKYPNWGYHLMFRERSTNGLVEGRLSQFFKLLFRSKNGDSKLKGWTLPGGLPDVLATYDFGEDTGFLTQQEHNYYLSQYERSMNGPFNYYRTWRLRWQEELDEAMLRVPPPDLPILLIIGASDPTSNQAIIGFNKQLMPHMQVELIERVGHWVMVQSKDFIAAAIPRFLSASKLRDLSTKL
ncbi:alpha/beta-hydrolase [Epithele typhae]|uniref:alpha/beta-hydrolase n=1 Tax=Epithele typhae TaxID=378194 RepID=UPI0020088870|nr:alpha/beta-hydrolase [Epithele typhae]KAH9943211.1 alpha/beta-hydrolase [Epithele typhae]